MELTRRLDALLAERPIAVAPCSGVGGLQGDRFGILSGLYAQPLGSDQMQEQTAELPTGTVTFPLSDIESFTRLVEELASSTYRELIEQQHALLRDVFCANGGVERGTEGDGFLVVFTNAESAVSAAVQAHRSATGAQMPPPVMIEADLDAERQEIGEEAVSEALAEGRVKSTEEVVDFAIRVLGDQ